MQASRRCRSSCIRINLCMRVCYKLYMLNLYILPVFGAHFSLLLLLLLLFLFLRSFYSSSRFQANEWVLLFCVSKSVCVYACISVQSSRAKSLPCNFLLFSLFLFSLLLFCWCCCYPIRVSKYARYYVYFGVPVPWFTANEMACAHISH